MQITHTTPTRNSHAVPVRFFRSLSILLWFCTLLASAVLCSAQTWSDNFDDGNGNNRWSANAGVWQIGSPTIGPETDSAG
jgi:hypothetical protein